MLFPSAGTRRSDQVLGRRDVHLWWFTADVPSVGPDRVTHEEQRRAAQFARADDAQRFLAGRARLRAVCSTYDPDAEVRHDSRGRPYLSDSSFSCSVAHSGDLIAVAIARRVVGVDVEQCRGEPLAREVLERCCTVAQRRRLARTPSELREFAFLRHWTRKEALCKARGTGLDLAVTGAAWSWHRGATWGVRDLDAPAGYAAAVAATGLGWHVTVRRGI